MVALFPGSPLVLTKTKGDREPGTNSHVILWHNNVTALIAKVVTQLCSHVIGWLKQLWYYYWRKWAATLWVRLRHGNDYNKKGEGEPGTDSHMISRHNNVTALIAKVVTQLYMYPRDKLTQTATCMVLQEFSVFLRKKKQELSVFLRNVHPQNLPDVISDNAELGTNEIHQMHELSQLRFC